MSSSSQNYDDRISKLPETIIVEVINKLPIADAVTSSILSKKWQYLWTLIPDLLFNIVDASNNKDVASFVKSVTGTIFFHNCSNIESFTVHMPIISFQSDVDSWVRFATLRHVRRLCLDFIVQDCLVKLPAGGSTICPMHYVLPRHLYTNDTIQRLHLCGCYIVPNPSVNWKSLISLYLDDTIMNNDIIQSIFQGSPSLKSLQVHECCGFSAITATSSTSLKKLVINDIGSKGDAPLTLDIDAPSVESLTLMGYFASTKCRVMNVSSSFKEAKLSFHFDECDEIDFYRELQLMLINLLQRLGHAAILRLGNCCLKVLSLKVTESMSFPYLSSKCLVLESLLGKCLHQGITTLLKFSQNLEILRFDSDIYGGQDDFHPPSACDNHCSEDFCWMSEKDLKHPLKELKTVELFSSKDRRRYPVGDVNAFAKYLQRNAPFLQKMTIFGQTFPVKR